MISVVLCTYNGEKYIKEQLVSIFNQTLRPDEIIVCDDNSNDSTIETIEKMQSTYPDVLVKIIKNRDNLGAAYNFINGIKIAKGDYIFFADQDDVWQDEKVEKMHERMLDSDSDIVLCNATIVDELLIDLNKSLWGEIRFSPCKHNLFEEMLKRNVFTGMCMEIKKSFFYRIPNYNLECMLHDEMFGWYVCKTGKVSFLEEQLVLYRQHNNNVIGSNSRNRFYSIEDAQSKIINSNEKKLSKLQWAYGVFDKNSCKQNEILNAIQFYEFRNNLYEGCSKQKVRMLWDYVKKGYYSIYASDTDRLLLKDIFMIISKIIIRK